MKTTFRSLCLLGCLVASASCGDAGATDDTDDVATMKLVGRYTTLEGGTLEVFEPESGVLVIGELIPRESGAQLLATTDAEAAQARVDSPAALYRKLVGGEPPVALLRAEQRAQERAKQEAASPSEQTAVASSWFAEPGRAEELATSLNKEVDRKLADFRARHCRDAHRTPGSEACQSTRICWTERSGDATVRENGVYGSMAVVRPYRGDVVFEVLYNGVSKSTRTVPEGATYRSWKGHEATLLTAVSPSAIQPHNLEVRVRGAEGDGFNLAVTATNQVRYAKDYSTEYVEADNYACSLTEIGVIKL